MDRIEEHLEIAAMNRMYVIVLTGSQDVQIDTRTGEPRSAAIIGLRTLISPNKLKRDINRNCSLFLNDLCRT